MAIAAITLFAVPTLDALKVWLDQNYSKVLKDSLGWKAINYMLNQWACISYYCEDGQLLTSNALAENVIRLFAVGRKAWLFSDTPKGARVRATCYPLVETAKADGLEPSKYINFILNNTAEGDTVKMLEALLPWHAKGMMPLHLEYRVTTCFHLGAY